MIAMSRVKEVKGVQLDSTTAVCPDFFREKAQVLGQKARKKAPALNVKFFIAFLDVSG